MKNYNIESLTKESLEEIIIQRRKANSMPTWEEIEKDYFLFFNQTKSSKSKLEFYIHAFCLLKEILFDADYNIEKAALEFQLL